METDVIENEVNGLQEPRKFLLDDESYALLAEAQRKIRDATEITPILRKIINALVTPEAVEKVTRELIKKYE